MNVINDLRNELALAVLVEKKHQGKINPREALHLIRQVQTVLQSSSFSGEEVFESPVSPEKEESKTAAH